MIPRPGPVNAISGPTFEKAAMKSLGSDAANGAISSPASTASAGYVPLRPSAETAIDNGSEAGKLTGCRPSFPAATIARLPAARASAIADFVASSGAAPPRLILIKSH